VIPTRIQRREVEHAALGWASAAARHWPLSDLEERLRYRIRNSSVSHLASAAAMNDGVFTPQWLFQEIEETLGRSFDLDVAACPWNTQCPVFITEEMDALKQDWTRWKTIYCNPPFEVPLVEQFVHKAIETAKAGSTIAMILPMWTRYEWYQEIKAAARIHDVIGSVAFKKPDGSSVTLNRSWGNTPLMVAFVGPDIPPGTHGQPFRRPSHVKRLVRRNTGMNDGSHAPMNDAALSGNGTVGVIQTTDRPFSLSRIQKSEKVRNEEAMTDCDHYAALIRQVKIVKDRVRGVVHRKCNGLYLYGRPGTSKTYTVCTTLDRLGVNYAYSNGHLTPIGLFDLILENRDRVIVLDDVSAIFNQPIALQILLGALGNRHDDTGVRNVRYKTARGDEVVAFSGGIIGISNLRISGHKNEVIRALNDRVFSINYDPSDNQIVALMLALARRGIRGIPSQECLTVCNFLLNEMRSRDIRPSTRLFVDKAMRDYELWKMQATETHWKDLIVSNLQEQVVELQHPTSDLGRTEQIEADRRIAADIFLNFDARNERIEAWKQRTNKSQPAFYRRLKEARANGLLPK
jgi:phage N-6-adenine-methyltransferase